MTPAPVPPRRTIAPALILALALLVGGLGVLSAVLYIAAPRPGAPAASAIGGPFALVDQEGRPFTERELAGRPSLVFFGFTHCPDICPTKLMELTQILDRMGRNAERVNAVFVTVDPERDTSALLKTYLGSFHPRIVGLTGSSEAVAGIMRAYRAFARRVPLDGGGYTMDHTVFVYLMDAQGRFVSTFDVARDPAAAAAELSRRL